MKTTKQSGHKALLLSCAAILAMQLTVSAATLVNRYSFSDVDDGAGNIGSNVVDSVGGPAWYGGLTNGGFFTGSQLQLAAGSQQYVQLPAGILSNYTAVTIDIWATFGTLPGACFLWAFGITDGGGAGGNCIFLHPQNGRLAISGFTPSWMGEENTSGLGDLSGQTAHVTAVVDPPSHTTALYKNGVLVSKNTSITVPLTSISNQLAYIARSLYNGDAYMDVSVDEYRIWNGALNALAVAGCDVKGPDIVGTAADAGTVTNIQITAGAQMVVSTFAAATVAGQATLLSYSVDMTSDCTYSSDNTNVLKVSASGQINAVGLGSATITAHYASLTSSQTITVIAPAKVLTHRYSFSEADGSTTVADSVGGVAWDGTLPNGGTFSSGELQLAAAGAQFVQLPSGIITNYFAVTVDAWATFPSTLPGACFFWGFGDINGASGGNYIYAQPSGGHIGITPAMPGWSGPEQTAGTYGNLSLQTNVHFTAVFNPAAGWIAVYKNGVLAGKNIAVTWPMSGVKDIFNYIARSLYSGDSYMDVNLTEFRLYNGALSSQEVAISDVAGPDGIPAAVTNGPGALLSVSVQVPATLVTPLPGAIKLLANYVNLTNWDIIANSIFPPTGLTVSTSDTNVLVFGADSLLHGVNPGTANVVVIYQGTTNTASVTVVQSPPATLVHQYSFGDAVASTTVTDSIGGAAWDGTLPNGGTFNGTGQLALTGGPSGSSSQYVNLPSGILSNYTAVTIEEWVTLQSNPAFTMYWAFGDTDGGGAGMNYLFADFGRRYTAISGTDPGYLAEQGAGGGSALPLNTVLHVATVCYPAQGYIALYFDGILQSINTGVTDPMSVVSANLAYINKSLYNDGYASETLDEFRIYNGALSPADLKITQLLGPNQLLAASPSINAAVSGGNVVLSWPDAAGAFALQSTTNLTSGVWTTLSSPSAQLVGSQWQVTVPNTGGNKFFRLVR